MLDRVRGTALAAVFITGTGMFGVFLFLTYYLQHTRGYSPAKTGLAFMPMSGSIVLSAIGSGTGLFRRLGARPRITGGMLLAAAGMAWMTDLSPDSAYVVDIVPAQVATGLGMGLITATAMNPGTALMSTLAAGSAAAYLAGRRPTPDVEARAALASCHTVFTASAVIFVAGAVLTFLMLPGGLSVERVHGAHPGRRPSGAARD
ncbi:hypothetical protein AB0H77_24440 [Streptomyces sp. NPDC050844]|uniref:hypothetical protein n=1 Tax=Streptomyces sp. NPDC050844 TaxID=3155790 RepID=UPI0033C6DFD2